MEKRGLIIGSYRTVADGQWTLSKCELGKAPQIQNFIDVPGRRKGPLDMSTVLTDGDPIYGSRPFEAILESSEGTRMERENRINTMTNWLDGWRQEIILPDDPLHFVVGRVNVERLYNDLAHASVRVTATCEPWKYNVKETEVILTPSETEKTVNLPNQGRLAVVPLLTITGGDVLLRTAGLSWALSAGSYALPDLLLLQGGKEITYSGAGTLNFKYREAIL